MNTKNIKVNAQKTIALVAHDNKKDELVAWAVENKSHLSAHKLIGTGTTAALISKHTGLEVEGLLSGPLGGDQQLGSRIAEGKVDILIFFWDPLEMQPHDPDVKALLRITTLYDVPLATSKTCADYIVSSALFNSEYNSEIVDNSFSIASRVEQFDLTEK